MTRSDVEYKVEFKTDRDADTEALARDFSANYGEDFDEKLGDFVVTAEPGKVIVVLRDVAKGDVRSLVEDVERDFDDEVELRMVYVSQSGSPTWFGTDLDEDDE